MNEEIRYTQEWIERRYREGKSVPPAVLEHLRELLNKKGEQK